VIEDRASSSAASGSRRTRSPSKEFDYIEAFFNRQRRHSAIRYVNPAEFERVFTEVQAA